MDPISIFNALHDTKCLKFGEYDLKSGLRAPYYMNLRRLPLYPELMEAVVAQVYEHFLSPQALPITLEQLRRRRETRSTSTNSQIVESINQELKKTLIKSEEEKAERKGKCSAGANSDSDSQLGDEEEVDDGSEQSSDWDEHHDDSCRNVIISGVPYGAVPLAAAIAYRARIPFLFERKETKSYGDHQALIENFDDQQTETDLDTSCKPKQPQPVILIEDVICSGESILEAARRLEKQNLRVEFVICIVDREENGINLLLQQAGIRVLSLYKISAILRVLEATGRIRGEQFRSIRQWIVDNQFKTIGVNPALTPKAQPIDKLDGNKHQVEVAAN